MRFAGSRAVHRATTANLQALYPFMAARGLGSRGVYLGQEIFGGAFCFDPWELYAQGRLTNPNVLVAGQVGRGKSALVKSLLWRSAIFGRRAAVLDPKGEYEGLARAVGVEPIRLAPGLPARLNPLDPGPGAAELGQEEVDRRRLVLLQAVAAAALGRDLSPVERAACRLALASVSCSQAVPTLPEVGAALLSPAREAAETIRFTAPQLLRASHDLALEVLRLCEGELRGMFDGPTTVSVDWNGPLVVLDLSRLSDDDSLGILMTCATAWIQAAVAHPDAGRRYLVLDEAWRLLHHLGTARWLRASLKLARQFGVANVLVMHRLSDLSSAGDLGSEQVQLANGLLSDTETRVIYAQAEGEITAGADLLGLTKAEREALVDLRRGVALWKVGRTTHLVRHVLSDAERAFVDTDQRMSGRGREADTPIVPALTVVPAGTRLGAVCGAAEPDDDVGSEYPTSEVSAR